MEKSKENKKEDGTLEKKSCKDNGQSRDMGKDEVFIDEVEANKVGKRTEAAAETARTGGRDEPIVRRSALARTPPLKRTHSLPDEGRGRMSHPWEEKTPNRTEVDKDKRKRGEESPAEASPKETTCKRQKEEKKYGEGKTTERIKSVRDFVREKRRPSIGSERQATRVINLMMLVEKETAILNKLIAENKNTKVQIKDSVGNLDKLMSQLMSPETLQLIEGKESTRDIAQVPATVSTAVQTDPMHTEKSVASEVVDSETQTERNVWQVKNEKLASTIRKRMVENRGYDGYKRLPTDSWPEEVYILTREVQGNPLWNGSEADVLLVTGKGKEEGNKGIVRQASRRFPELFDTQGDELENKGCITMVYEARMLSSQEQKDGMGRRTVSRVWAEEDEMDIYMNLLSLKENLVKMGIIRMAALVSPERSLQVRRMWEHVFCGTEVKLLLYSPTKKTRKENKVGKTQKTSARSNNRTKKTDAVIVSMPGKSFEDLLSTVKEKVDVRTLGITVKGVSSTRRGDLLLTLDKGGGADRLKDEIKDKIKSEEITVRTGNEMQKVINVRGLDATAKEQDIAEAIRAALPDESMARVKVRSIYPAFGRRQNAVIEVDSADGEYLLHKGSIQVGWALCKVQERVGIRKCPRCWGFGHGAARCRGPDRSTLCLKCGRQGHKVKDCGEDAFCPVCNRAGHRADSATCPAFRAQLERVRSLSMQERQVDNDRDMEQDRVIHLEEEGLCPND